MTTKTLLLSTLLGLCACGADGHITGGVAGRAFPFGDAVFAVLPLTDANGATVATLGAVYVTASPDACEELAHNIVHSNSTVMVGELLVADPTASAADQFSFGAGSYAIEDPNTLADQLDSAAPRPTNLGELLVSQTDAYCQVSLANQFFATQGIATVSAYKPQDSLRLNLDVVMETGDRLTGTMTAHYCNALSILFNDCEYRCQCF